MTDPKVEPPKDDLKETIELLVYGIRNDGWNNGFNTPDEPWVAQIFKIIKLQQEALQAEYDEIFKWLLGETGDFPQSVEGARYNWRPELRKRLNKLRLEL